MYSKVKKINWPTTISPCNPSALVDRTYMHVNDILQSSGMKRAKSNCCF